MRAQLSLWVLCGASKADMVSLTINLSRGARTPQLELLLDAHRKLRGQHEQLGRSFRALEQVGCAGGPLADSPRHQTAARGVLCACRSVDRMPGVGETQACGWHMTCLTC